MEFHGCEDEAVKSSAFFQPERSGTAFRNLFSANKNNLFNLHF